jgi:hypothetical protein
MPILTAMLILIGTLASAAASAVTDFGAINFGELNLRFFCTKTDGVSIYASGSDSADAVITLAGAGQPAAVLPAEDGEYVKLVAVQDRHVVFGTVPAKDLEKDFEELEPWEFLWLAGDTGAAHLLYSEFEVEYEPQAPTKEDPAFTWTPAVNTRASANQADWTWNEFAVVYLSKSGAKYHYLATCSNMKNPDEVSLDYALDIGREPCSKCVK